MLLERCDDRLLMLTFAMMGELAWQVADSIKKVFCGLEGRWYGRLPPTLLSRVRFCFFFLLSLFSLFAFVSFHGTHPAICRRSLVLNVLLITTTNQTPLQFIRYNWTSIFERIEVNKQTRILSSEASTNSKV